MVYLEGHAPHAPPQTVLLKLLILVIYNLFACVYVWSPKQVSDVNFPGRAYLYLAYYGIAGNFDG